MHDPSDAMNDTTPIVAVGASAGGVEALQKLLKNLPSSMPAILLVVLHRPLHMESRLADVLARHTKMPVCIAEENTKPKPGVCYVGRPDQHLVFGSDGRLHLLKDGFYRAHNIDALFNSLAMNAPKRSITVILSGLRKDGALGMRAVKDAGGMTLVQSPIDALHPEMPANAIAFDGPIDFIGTAEELATRLVKLITGGGLPAVSNENEDPPNSTRQSNSNRFN